MAQVQQLVGVENFPSAYLATTLGRMTKHGQATEMAGRWPIVGNGSPNSSFQIAEERRGDARAASDGSTDDAGILRGREDPSAKKRAHGGGSKVVYKPGGWVTG
jgi:hypothetical protein